MRKTKKQKGKHSSPQTAGKQNFPKGYVERVKNTGGGNMDNILKIYEHGFTNREDYSGLWDRESLQKEVMAYFRFSALHDIKPAKAGLRMWLGLSHSQYYEWEKAKLGDFKSDILQQARDFMELQYICKGETNPTMNMFLLKAGWGYAETQNININGKDSESVKDNIKKLGLDQE